MNGGLTWQDLDALKAKAAARDEALAYLEGRCDSEKLLAVQRILAGLPAASATVAKSVNSEADVNERSTRQE